MTEFPVLIPRISWADPGQAPTFYI